jgi:hypothetical protein
MIHVVQERVIMVLILYLVVINVKTGVYIIEIVALLIGRWTYYRLTIQVLTTWPYKHLAEHGRSQQDGITNFSSAHFKVMQITLLT